MIIFIGIILRFTNINWDEGYGFHPDEPYLTRAASQIRFPENLDPGFYVYGSLPVYIYHLSGMALSQITGDSSWITSLAQIAVLGRILSAFLSVINIILIFNVSRIFLPTGSAMISALLLTFSPWAIREAHFATTDTALVTIVLSMLIFGIRLVSKFDLRSVLMLGFLSGLVIAIKPNGLILFYIPLVSLFLSSLKIANAKQRVIFIFKFGIIFFLLSGITFSVCSPYLISNFREAGHQIKDTVMDILGLRPQAYFTLQFTNTWPYIYQMETFFYQSGLIGLVGSVGLFIIFIKALISKNNRLFLVSSFPLFYFSVTGYWFAKFSRYNLIYLTLATFGFTYIFAKINPRKPASRLFWLIMISCTVILGLANWNIYLRPQTRIQASEWINTNIPAGSIILREDANETLPLIHEGGKINYSIIIWRVYDPEISHKISLLKRQLTEADYLIFATRRVYGTMPHLKSRFPRTAEVYNRLFNGQLGYTEIARFSSYPQIFNLSFADNGVEETFQIFDHPTVIIMKNMAKQKDYRSTNQIKNKKASLPLASLGLGYE